MGVLGIYWGVSGLRKKVNLSDNRNNHTPADTAGGSNRHDDHDNQIHSLWRDVFRLAKYI